MQLLLQKHIQLHAEKFKAHLCNSLLTQVLKMKCLFKYTANTFSNVD